MEPRQLTMPAPRVAVLLPYWNFWEASVGPRFRSERESLLADVVGRLVGVDVVWSGLVADPDEGVGAAAAIVDTEPDAVLVAQSMAVPPAHATTALDAVDLPVVIWAVQTASTIADSFDAAAITTMGATVGTPMLTNVLHRRERPFELHVSPIDDETAPPQLTALLSAAAVAHRLSRARIARVGSPVPGYDCVDVDDDTLSSATGLEVVPVSPVEIRDRYRAVPDDHVARRRGELSETYDVKASGEDLDRSLRIALAIEGLDEDESISLGAMNCHVPEIRFGDEPGVTPCFGLGIETSRGIPWTCSGDVLTAVAMFVGRSLGGASLYHEIEAIDFTTGEVALANTGEHDLGWCRAGMSAELSPNAWFESDAHTGVSARFELPPGPASLVGFTPHPAARNGFRLVVAEGEITGRELPRSPTSGGLFRFGSGPVTEAWQRWAASGVNHHSAACPGHLADRVATVARYLRIDCVVV